MYWLIVVLSLLALYYSVNVDLTTCMPGGTTSCRSSSTNCENYPSCVGCCSQNITGICSYTKPPSYDLHVLRGKRHVLLSRVVQGVRGAVPVSQLSRLLRAIANRNMHETSPLHMPLWRGNLDRTEKLSVHLRFCFVSFVHFEEELLVGTSICDTSCLLTTAHTGRLFSPLRQQCSPD